MIGFYELRDTEEQYFRNEFGEDHFYTSEEIASTGTDNREEIDTLSVFVDSEVSKGAIDTFPNLEHITTRSTGYDHIDVDYATQQNIAVSNVPAYGSESVAEYAFALLLSLVRNVHTSYHQTQEHGRFSLEGLRGIALAGKTMGIIGTGAIGSHTAQIADGFGMDVLAFDPQPNQELSESFDVSYVDEVPDLLAAADVISLHVPLNEHTHHLIDEESFEVMKDTAYLINTARGGVVDTKALVEAVESEKIAGVGLDVLEKEDQLGGTEAYSESAERNTLQTMLADHALINHPRVLVTPHVGFYTQNAEEEIMETTAENIQTYYDNNQPANTVAS